MGTKNFFYRVNPNEILAELTALPHDEWLKFLVNFFHDLRNDEPDKATTQIAAEIIREAHQFRAKRSIAGKASAQQRATNVEHMLSDVEQCSTSSSSSTEAITETETESLKALAETEKKSVQPKRKKTDEEWLNEIKGNPAYQGINFDVEIGKAQAWCMTKSRKCTRAFLLNWFNRAEKPVVLNGKPGRLKSFRERVNDDAVEGFLKGDY